MTALFSEQWEIFYRGRRTSGLWLPRNAFVAIFVLACLALAGKEANIPDGVDDEF
jgi:hypothetical protein